MSATSGCRADRPPSSRSVSGQMSRTSKTSRAPKRRAQRDATGSGNSEGDDTRIASGGGSRWIGRRSRRRANAAMLTTRARLMARSYGGTATQQ